MIITRPPLSGATGPVSGAPTVNLWAWYEPSRETGYTNGTGISPLTDQGGNSRNFTQAVSGSRPLYDTTDALNGLAVASFSTNRVWDTGPDMSGLGTGGATNAGQTLQGHVFCVVKSDQAGGSAGTARELWRMSSSGAGAYYPYSDGQIYESCIAGSRFDNITPGTTLNNWRVYEAQMKCSSSGGTANGTYILRIDGTAIHNENGTGIIGAGWPAAPTIGKGADGTFFNGGLFAGLYLYSQMLTSGQRSTVIAYINARFGLSSS